MELEQSSTDGVSPAAGGAEGRKWVFPALLAVVLLAMAWAGHCGRNAGGKAATRADLSADWIPMPEGQTVSLRIDFANGAEKRFAALAWHEGMTVADLMRLARRFPPGLAFTQQGEGEAGFLGSIDGLGNETGIGRNWRYQVNGRPGEVSFCVYPLRPEDTVLCTYAAEE